MSSMDLIDAALSRALDRGFTHVARHPDGIAMMKGDLTVILSYSTEEDSREWLHLSYSHPKRLPGYDTTKLVKEIFLGDRKAIMVFPQEKEYVNIHPFCLHLFSCVTEDVLPDFTRGSGRI